MEKPREQQEDIQVFRGKIESVIELPNGMVSIDFGPQKDIDGDIKGFLLSLGLQEKLGIKGSLLEGMEVVVTTDQSGHIIKIEKILQ